jgi:uncharacterized protein
MFHSLGNQPLNDTECDRFDEMLSRFQSEHAINNMEELDGFFAALICSPDMVMPSTCLSEIWGGEMADEEAFTIHEELQDFLGLLFRHWNSIVRVFVEEELFTPLLIEDQDGIAHANDWTRGFMRGTFLHADRWRELFNDEAHAGALIPILVLAHEHDPDDEMRPFKEPIDTQRREKLIVGVAVGVNSIYRYFAPHRKRMAQELASQGSAHYRTARKIGRNTPCPCGSGKKYKRCCAESTLQ